VPEFSDVVGQIPRKMSVLLGVRPFSSCFWHQIVQVTHKTPLFNTNSDSMKMFLYARCQYNSNAMREVNVIGVKNLLA